MQNNPIYVIGTGEYEDYVVVTTTTDKVLAEKLQEKMERDFCREFYIEECLQPEAYLQNLYWFQFNEDGTLAKYQQDTSFFNYELAGQCLQRYKYVTAYVIASSLEEAREIAEKQYAEFMDKSKKEV